MRVPKIQNSIPQVGDTSFSGNVLPAEDARYDLGSESKRFRRIYVKEIIYAGTSVGSTSVTDVDADTVDGLHAYPYPVAGALLALNQSSVFDPGVYNLAVLTNGTRGLTADWSAGLYRITTQNITINDQLTVSPSSQKPPIILGANAQGQVVSGFLSDRLYVRMDTVAPSPVHEGLFWLVSRIASTGVSVDSGAASVLGRVISVSAGAPSIRLDVASLSSYGRSIGISGVSSVILDSAAPVMSGRQLIVEPGNISIATDTGVITATGRTAIISGGSAGVSVSVDSSTATATGRPFVVTPGAKSTALSVGSSSIIGRSISVSAGTAALVDIDHEENNLNEYTSTQTDSGDLSVSASAALSGTNYGLSCVIDDTNSIYGEKTVSSSTGTIRARVYIDPNTMTMAASNAVVFLRIMNGSSQIVAYAQLVFSASVYNLRVGIYADTGVPSTATLSSITDASHYIEFKVVRATGESTNDGYIDWWIDGSSRTSVTGIDNYTRFASAGAVQLGAITFTGTPTGTLYLDELIVNNTGDEIGA